MLRVLKFAGGGDAHSTLAQREGLRVAHNDGNLGDFVRPEREDAITRPRGYATAAGERAERGKHRKLLTKPEARGANAAPGELASRRLMAKPHARMDMPRQNGR